MKKKSLLLTILSVIAAVSLAIPVFAAFAESDGAEASAEKTITVEIFNGSNADELDFTNQSGATTATVVDDDGVTAIQVAGKWSGFILFNDTIDLTKAKDGQLCFEYKTTGDKAWAKVAAVTYAGYWKQPVTLNFTEGSEGKSEGNEVGLAADYTVKKYDLSPLTEAQLAKFRGFAIGTDGTFLFKRIWVEYPNPDYVDPVEPGTPSGEGTYELIAETEPVTAAQDSTWQYVAVIPSEYGIKAGDKIKITYSIVNEVPETGKAFDMWVGDSKISFNGETQENYVFTQTGTWKYTFNAAYSGDIKFGLWSTVFSISSAELTIIKNEEVKVTGYDIFTGITEVGEPAQNAAGTAWTAAYTAEVSGKVVSDGTALAFGTLEDGTYYVTGTNAKTSTRATIAMTDITSALLGGGKLTFKAKFDFASEEGRYVNLRIFYECGQWGEAAFVEVPFSDYVAGEWKDYSVALTTLNVGISANSTFGNPVNGKWFDWTKFVGIGLASGSSGEGDNVVSFADVKITDVNEKTIKGIEAVGAKTDYSSGDDFDTTGMTVNVVLDDDTKVEVKNYTVAPEKLAADTEKVTVSWSYNGKTYTTDIAVTVTAEFASIKVKTNPTKTAYKSGEKFDKSGMVVVAVKADEDETEVEITDYACYTGVLYSGMTTVEIEYLGLKTTVAVTVSDFEHKLSLTEKAFAKDGEPNYGWKAQVASKELTSEAKYNAATEADQAKLAVTPKDAEKGYYITAKFDSNNYATRIFENGVADYKLYDIYDEIDYSGTISITYRTTSTFDKAVNFGLANFKEWNLGYHNADISSYIVSDGEWHTMYFDIALCVGEVDGMLWGGITGDVDLNKVVGFAVQSKAEGTLDIIDVSVNWNGPEDAAKAVDTTAPEYTYGGEMTIRAKAGDSAPDFSSEKARDKNDGEIKVTVEWSVGALTADGKLNEGTHTVKLYAVDKAGNKTEPYIVQVIVEKDETPDDSTSGSDSVKDSEKPSSGESAGGSTSGSDSSKTDPTKPDPANKGCLSAVNTVSVSAVVLLIAGAFVLAKKKKED